MYDSVANSVFDNYMKEFADDVSKNFSQTAASGTAGTLSDSGENARTIRIDEHGHELNQLFSKGLIGALCLDQIVNNYITPLQLDSGTRTQDNTDDKLADGKNYTDMEHKWDEGFGYVYGQEADVTLASVANAPLGSGTQLMKYLKKVNDSNEPGIAEKIYKAFVVGRAAIVAKDYHERDNQARIIQRLLSKVIAYKSIDYLNDYMSKNTAGNKADAFHALSEGYGFIYSLQFTNGGMSYFTKTEVDSMLSELDDFWSVNDTGLNEIISKIKSRFNMA